jgi:hypothetical protein
LADIPNFANNYDTEIWLDTTPSSATASYAYFGYGITGAQGSSGDDITTVAFLADKGSKTTFVSGIQLVYNVAGWRIYDDPAQDFAFSVLGKTGKDRMTRIKVVEGAEGARTERFGQCTLSNFAFQQGDADKPAQFSVDVSINGQLADTDPATT